MALEAAKSIVVRQERNLIPRPGRFRGEAPACVRDRFRSRRARTVVQAIAGRFRCQSIRLKIHVRHAVRIVDATVEIRVLVELARAPRCRHQSAQLHVPDLELVERQPEATAARTVVLVTASGNIVAFRDEDVARHRQHRAAQRDARRHIALQAVPAPRFHGAAPPCQSRPRARDDVDHPRYGIRAVERGLLPAQDFDAQHILGPEPAEVERPVRRVCDLDPIDQHDNLVGLRPAQAELRETRIRPRAIDRQPRHGAEFLRNRAEIAHRGIDSRHRACELVDLRHTEPLTHTHDFVPLPQAYIARLVAIGTLNRCVGTAAGCCADNINDLAIDDLPPSRGRQRDQTHAKQQAFHPRLPIPPKRIRSKSS